MKLQVLVLLMSWFGVLSWVQAEFFTSIGMWQQNSSLPKQPSAKCKGLSLPEARSGWGSLVIDFDQSRGSGTYKATRPPQSLTPYPLGDPDERASWEAAFWIGLSSLEGQTASSFQVFFSP